MILVKTIINYEDYGAILETYEGRKSSMLDKKVCLLRQLATNLSSESQAPPETGLAELMNPSAKHIGVQKDQYIKQHLFFLQTSLLSLYQHLQKSPGTPPAEQTALRSPLLLFLDTLIGRLP